MTCGEETGGRHPAAGHDVPASGPARAPRRCCAYTAHALSAALAAVGLAAPRTAEAGTIAVDTAGAPAPDGHCSLLEAIQAANTDLPVDSCPAGLGADVIVLAPATYPFFGPLEIAGSLTLQGAGADTTTILGAGNSGPTIAGISAADCNGVPASLYAAASLRLMGVTLEQAPSAVSAGLCLVAGPFAMSGVRVTGFQRGGVFARSNTSDSFEVLLEAQSRVDHNANQVDGAGLFVVGLTSLAVHQSTIDDNVSQGRGGGVYWAGNGDNNMETAVVENNTATEGGGIYLDPDQATYFRFFGTTISGNRATGTGGGAFVGPFADPITFFYSVLAGNEADTDGQQANLNPNSGFVECLENSWVAVSGSEWSTLPYSDGTCRYDAAALDGGVPGDAGVGAVPDAGPGVLGGPTSGTLPSAPRVTGGCAVGAGTARAPATSAFAAAAAGLVAMALVLGRRVTRGERRRPRSARRRAPWRRLDGSGEPPAPCARPDRAPRRRG